MSSKRGLGERSIVLLVVLTVVLVLAPDAGAQSKYKILHGFAGGQDGGYPEASLILDRAANLYGTTNGGTGSGDYGTVLKLTPNSDGSRTETVLYNFTGGNDGAQPAAGLIFDQAGNLYGTASQGGLYSNGVVYQLTPSKTGYTESVLYSFAGGHDGATPLCTLIFDSSGNLYGTTNSSGAYGYGTVFELTPHSDGKWTIKTLYDFVGGEAGGSPDSGLVLDTQGNLYGITTQGGDDNVGVVYRLKPSNFFWTISVLHSFTGGNDGGRPQRGSLIFDNSGNLYGTTLSGGHYQYGTVFKLTPTAAKWKETVLHNFANRDGAFPSGTLVFSPEGDIYGTTQAGGDLTCQRNNGCGVVFKLSLNSNGEWHESVLHRFLDLPGAGPVAGVIFDATGNLYGTTSSFSQDFFGAVFEIRH